MSNNLPTLLAELSEIVPQVCQSEKYGTGPVMYIIGEYQFWFSVGTLCAKYQNNSVAGLPAYDWLQGALMRVIREQGMYWELRYSKPRNRYQAEIANHTVWNNDATEALLIAFVTALKGEQ